MIKTILVPTSGSDTDQRVFATALSMARPLGAHIEFFHVRLSTCEAAVHTPHVEFCVGPAITNALDNLDRRQAEQSAKALDHAKTFCSSHEIAFRDTPSISASVTAEIVEEIDHAESRLLARARHSDLLVLGRPRYADLMPYDLIESLLLGSGRPVVIAPESLPARPSGTIVVAWQETPAAARALSAALPLLKLANRIVLINVGESEAGTSSDLDRVAKQLSWHGVFAETKQLLGAAKSATQVLLQAASDLNPELLVVGGFSHRPLQESIFGGATRSLLEHAETPIFMMH
jgi:nucleotide-binding universal stress UspA family protein